MCCYMTMGALGVCMSTNEESIGPFDLAKQMGVTRGGDEHEAAIQRILKAAKDAGKTAAIFCEFFSVFCSYFLPFRFIRSTLKGGMG